MRNLLPDDVSTSRRTAQERRTDRHGAMPMLPMTCRPPSPRSARTWRRKDAARCGWQRALTHRRPTWAAAATPSRRLPSVCTKEWTCTEASQERRSCCLSAKWPIRTTHTWCVRGDSLTRPFSLPMSLTEPIPSGTTSIRYGQSQAHLIM